MLFIVKAKHDADMCPVGSVRPNPDFVKSIMDQAEKSKVKLIGSYSNPPSHTLWFIVEAQTMPELTTFCLPLLQIGKVKTIPVDTLEAMGGKFTELGLMR